MKLPSRYEMIRKLGSGGLGTVYQVRDRQDGDLKALKAIPLHGEAGGARLRSLQNEFQILSTLRHPHLVRVYDFHIDPQMAFLNIEYLAGKPFLPFQKQQGVALETSVMQICEALDYLHSQGIIHGDLKPDNIWLTKSGVKLLDFSLAQTLSKSRKSPGLGTKGYQAPETLEGSYSPASDFYSLGKILSQATTERKAPVSPRLQRVLSKLLRPDPAERYGSARQIIEDLAGREKWQLDATLSFHPHVAALIGREREWAQLLESRAQGKRVIVVTGEKGVGKTRLIDEYRTHCLKNGWHCSIGAEGNELLMTLPRWNDLPDNVQILFEGDVTISPHPALLCIQLSPLPPESLGRLAAAHLGRKLPPSLIDTLGQVTAGNPLQLREALGQWVHHEPKRLKKILHGEPNSDWVPWIGGAAETSPVPSQVDEDLGLLHTLFGNYREALKHYQAAGNRAREALLYHRLGDFAQALSLYQALLQSNRHLPPEQKIQVLALQSMILLALGKIQAAEQTCQRAMRLKPQVRPLYQVSAYNALGLVQRSKSELSAAAESYQCAWDIIQHYDLPNVQATILNNQALIHQERQHFSAAEEAYQKVLTLAQRIQDRVLELTALQNLGTLAQERGDFGAALRFYQQAKANAELSGETKRNLLFNLATLFLQLGDRTEVEGTLRALASEETEGERPEWREKIGLLRVELALTWHDWDAFARMQDETFTSSEAGRVCLDLMSVGMRLDRSDAPTAKQQLAAMQPVLKKLNNDGFHTLHDLYLARCHLAGGSLPDAEPLLTNLYRYCRLKQKGALLWEVCYERGHAAELRGDTHETKKCFLESLDLLDKMYRSIPPGLNGGFFEVPRRKALRDLMQKFLQKTPSRQGEPMRSQDKERYQRLLELNQQLNSQQQMEPLLERILDSALELTGAKRGFLISRKDAGTLREIPSPLNVIVARQMDRKFLDHPEFQYSRSLVEQVIRSGTPLLIEEANRDTRFVDYQSIHDLGLKSILLCPLQVNGHVQGVIYVDNHSAPNIFSREDLDILQALGGQAAIALGNLQLVSQLTHSKQEVQELNKQLTGDLKNRETELRSAQTELARAKQDLEFRYNYENIVGQSSVMRDVFHLLDRVTDTDIPVLIHGESGSGKELIARALHYNSSRKQHPFISENCAAIPENLLESELFGHKKGAFTGAESDHEGLFQQADGGTLFLDEIGDLPLKLQPKLLRVLQEKSFRPLGNKRWLKVDVRIVAASHQDLQELTQAGKFREDLFYRLHGIQVSLPSLRERREDIPLLIDHFFKKFSRDTRRRPPLLERTALDLLVSYPWPGNIRELESTLRNAFLLNEKSIGRDGLRFKPELFEESPRRKSSSSDTDSQGEKDKIIQALKKTGYNKVKTAKHLGWSRKTLYNKMELYNISTQTGLC